MNIWDLAGTINKKIGGDVNDFIDYLIIIRKWMDKNPYLAEAIMGNFIVSKKRCETDTRLLELRKQILNKPTRREEK